MASSLSNVPSPGRAHRPTHLQRMVSMPKPAQYPRQPDGDWLLELGNLLQTTLEVEKLITLFTDHAQSVVRHDSVTFEFEEQDIRFTLGTPQGFSCTYDVVLLDDYLGTLTLTRAERFSDEEIGTLEYMLVGLVHPLRNAYLYREALRVASQDPLTGINNRTMLDRSLDREIELSRRHGTPLSVIMLDVDRFKSINDTYGHVVGDYTLKALADCIVTCTRDSDVVFRYGGEEFIILLSNTRLDGAAFLAERIREAVEQLSVGFDDTKFTITVSLGVASLDEQENRVRLLEKVDRALYESKEGGRNRVTASAS